VKLYGNEISSATSRVRIALALKGLKPDFLSIGILGERAENRQAAYLEVNPQGLVPARVAAHLRASGFGTEEIGAWNRHWMTVGFGAIEALLASRPARAYAADDTPSVADLFLFPQAINAERAGLMLDRWPRLSAIVDRLSAIPEFSIYAPAPRK